MPCMVCANVHRYKDVYHSLLESTNAHCSIISAMHVPPVQAGIMFEVPDMEDPATLSIIVPLSCCVVPLHVGEPVII